AADRKFRRTGRSSCRVRGEELRTRSGRGLALSRPDLTASADAVFEGGQLFDPNRPARMQPPRRDSDLGAEAEFAAIGELGRGIMQHDRRVYFAQELLCRRPIV